MTLDGITPDLHTSARVYVACVSLSVPTLLELTRSLSRSTISLTYIAYVRGKKGGGGQISRNSPIQIFFAQEGRWRAMREHLERLSSPFIKNG